MAISNRPTNLGSLIDTVLTQKDWQRRLRLHQVFLFWDEVVGEEIARHAQPQVIRGDVLWIAASDSIWMQQLLFERHHIMELINTRLAAGEVQSVAGTKAVMPPHLKDIKFTLDPAACRRQPLRPPPPLAREIDHEQLAQFSASLNSIEDQETRESLKRLWLVMHRRTGKAGVQET